MRNLILSAVVAGIGLFGAAAQASDTFQAGREYVQIGSPVPVSQPGKIEVVELFWYGCPHCDQFEPHVLEWAGKQPEDVNFVRIPALFGGVWNLHGQLFLTLEAMEADEKVHAAIFNALHREGKKLANLEEITAFLATQGIDTEAFTKTFNSFAIKGQMEKARKLAMAYQITGVPVMIVNGKYRFDLGSAGGAQGALKVADHLIEQERAAR
ncbi:thiol:disulfide interchange protein DsbA/DsbL [Pseudomonas sp. NW5]|uniref:thiol:disulfide interchange protein DsbA/DsbL n=1 Tax=Pseudomonas sp. NW5 TaxID=2934934 RepID=UPI00202250FB|nr:thiol:disulfide interchange protein DsbA/DsbL [Pseudomonas sp. NW5]MCL7461350.1 thiol:disulfide interchange protein DsbA/DsbL [Pseudomonas sp. NW5]